MNVLYVILSLFFRILSFGTTAFLLCLILEILVPFHWDNGFEYLEAEYYKAFTPGRIGYLFLVFALTFCLNHLALIFEKAMKIDKTINEAFELTEEDK